MNCKFCNAEMESSTTGICWECLLKTGYENTMKQNSEEALMSLFGDNEIKEENE